MRTLLIDGDILVVSTEAVLEVETYWRDNGLAIAAHRRKRARSHCKADAMAQEPSGLIVGFEYAEHLVSADAFL